MRFSAYIADQVLMFGFVLAFIKILQPPNIVVSVDRPTCLVRISGPADSVF